MRLDNLLVTAPRPRNLLLADAFKRAGIVERTARGIDTIFYEQLRNGRPAPSYERSDATGMVVLIPGGEANLDFVRLLVTEAQRGRETHARITRQEVEDLCRLNRDQAYRLLKRLVNQGRLRQEQARGRGVGYTQP